MEHVKVTFPTRRLVHIDGEPNGHTNKVLRLDAGTHMFTLGPRANYKPSFRKVMVRGTSILKPLIVKFEKTDDN